MIISFKPHVVTNNLVSVLKDRTRDILSHRFGLKDDPQRKTLEAIGEKYDITRERVRQIINFALRTIRQSPAIKEAEAPFAEIKTVLDKKGGVLSEKEIFGYLGDDPLLKNHSSGSKRKNF
jgi:hypothetical protein